jgi:hypothetical protein
MSISYSYKIKINTFIFYLTLYNIMIYDSSKNKILTFSFRSYDIDMSNEQYTINRIASETTEDGDLLITWEVMAKGFAGIRDFSAEANRFIQSWVGCGNGFLKGQYNILVDGAEIAIEARNDAWASHQQAIEDNCLGRGW